MMAAQGLDAFSQVGPLCMCVCGWVGGWLGGGGGG